MKVSHIKACENIVAVSDPWKRLHETLDFRTILSPNKTAVKAFVCLSGAEPAGFILFSPEPVFARGGYLRAIAVAPAFRGQGVGKMMLSFAESMTSERAIHFFLCVSSFNRRAQTFYKKCGYVRAGTLPDLIMPGAAEHIYWKKIRMGKAVDIISAVNNHA